MRLAAFSMLAVAVPGTLLLGATMAQHMQDTRRLALAAQQSVADRALIVELGVQLKDARHALSARPVVEKPVPCSLIMNTPDIGHPTPVFSRESQTYAGHR